MRRGSLGRVQRIASQLELAKAKRREQKDKYAMPDMAIYVIEVADGMGGGKRARGIICDTRYLH